MDKAILYIHGKGGNPKEAEYYKALFEEYDVIGFDYSSQSPWEAKKEFPRLFDNLCGTYETVTVIANSIGAFFAMMLSGKLNDAPSGRLFRADLEFLQRCPSL